MSKAASTNPVKLLAKSLLNVVLQPLRWQCSNEKESSGKWASLCFPSTNSESWSESEIDMINPDMLNINLIYYYWGELTLAGHQFPPSHSLTPPLEQRMGENKMEKLMGWDKDQSPSLAKLTRLGTKLNVLYCQLKIDQDGEKQRQNPPYPLPSSQGQLQPFTHKLLYCLLSKQYRGWGMGCCGQPITVGLIILSLKDF